MADARSAILATYSKGMYENRARMDAKTRLLLFLLLLLLLLL